MIDFVFYQEMNLVFSEMLFLLLHAIIDASNSLAINIAQSRVEAGESLPLWKLAKHKRSTLSSQKGNL